MNTLWVVAIAVVVIYLAYNYYARQIDRNVIQSDAKKATPAKMYMDGVDFMPTSRNVLYGYHFKSIAAAGPIVGVITAANIWGWLPAILWLMIGVSFIGWASDYSAIMMAVPVIVIFYLGQRYFVRGVAMTGMPPVRGFALSRRVASRPSIPGRLRSISTTSGDSVSAADRPSAAVIGSPAVLAAASILTSDVPAPGIP